MLMIASTIRRRSAGPHRIRVAPQDADDIADILSIGSRIVVRR